MKELKILAVVIALTLVVYYGIEPLAHSLMHKNVSPVNYNFAQADIEAISDVAQRKEIKKFWQNAQDTLKLKGNVENGKNQVSMNCIACHSIEKENIPPMMDNKTLSQTYGVVPPDLSTAGAIYDDLFLVAFLNNPALATKVTHKFTDGKIHPMPSYDWLSAQDKADIIAYLKSIAPKKLSNKDVFKSACLRCHSIKYADFKGTSMRALTTKKNLIEYMGTFPPDLSQYIKSRSSEYLNEFINDPQKHLEGTAMPRVGLNKKAQAQVIAYMKEVGDKKAQERELLGVRFLIYFAFFALIAFLWKIKLWKEVH